MLTRGKVHNNSDEVSYEGAADEDGVNDGDSSEKGSLSSKDRQSEERGSILPRSSSSLKTKHTPKPNNPRTLSPVLSGQRLSRRSNFVTDVSSEDTPLSLRKHVESVGKRFTLFPKEVHSEEAEAHLNSTEENIENHGSEDKRLYCAGDSENENPTSKHHDGVRRSQRPKKILHGSYNDSWIFAEKSVKGYPTIQGEDKETEGSRRSKNRRREVTIKEEHEGEDDEDEEEGSDSRDNRRMSKRLSETRARSSSKRTNNNKGSRHSPSGQDMYSRIKTRSLRSSGASSGVYSGYQSTVRNAKKASAKSSRRRFQGYDCSSEPDSKSDSDSTSDDETVHAKNKNREELSDQSRDPDGEEPQIPRPAMDGERIKGKYTLRKIQPIERYCPIENKNSRGSPPPRSRLARYTSRISFSPAHRAQRKRRQKAQNESTTSSSSSDEERFERRKNKSMSKARNRCLPMNFSPDDLVSGVVKDRAKIGSSLADVDPMKIDREITFEQVGGLETYIRSLKEMILFPLLYPEIFKKFSIQPPRGVLFYGPPGTGKTLVARCLANECSQKDRRVAFFMRKGADCLSKWVGESERQLRLLFDQAYQMRPSIIFFDEIDGLAPVRSTRQDQIHSSIVSTLLALMDGLDSRGEVIIIGATNRLDAIDPALRRPGRFDREFHFPLPSLPARKEILDIHLKSWTPSPSPSLVQYLSQKTVGYCGADLKALCAEAALLALRRRYPQVYQSKDKLLLDLSQINVERRDFDQAVQRLVPASQRSTSGSGKPLSTVVTPLLENLLQQLIKTTQSIFPEGVATLKLKGPLNGIKKQTSNQIFPRLLVLGDSCTQLTSALLHYIERLPVHRLDLSTLHGLSARSPEEACVQLFLEARRNVPAVIYLPLVNRWWSAVSDTVRSSFLTQLSELDAELPILLLVTCDCDLENIPEDFCDYFHQEDGEIFETRSFTEEERQKFFRPLLLQKCLKSPILKKLKNKLEVLPLAPAPPPRQLSEKEKELLERKEEATLRELRIFLREILAKMARNKLFYMFTRPVDTKEVPDYLDIIQQPMDLETMMTKIDQHAYESAHDFLADIERICSNALEYNPDLSPEDKMIRHRACTLRDTAYALIKAEMDTDFEEQCQEISRTRKVRKDKVAAVPDPHIALLITPNPITPSQETKGNGEATKSELRSAKVRHRKSAWSQGNIKSKKRRTESVNGSSPALNDSLTAPLDNPSTPVIEDKKEEESFTIITNPVSSNEVTEDQIVDDSQTSDALDSQTEMEPTSTALVTSKKSVQIDSNHLNKLLDVIVAKTENWNLERLLRLYSKLSKLIDRYLKLWDRRSLVKDIEQMLVSCR